MKKRLSNLLNVKSIVTLLMTALLVALMFAQVDPPKELLSLYCTSYGAVLAYYFNRKDDEKNGDSE